MNGVIRKVLFGVAVVITCVVIVFTGMFIYLSMREYKPKDIEMIKVQNNTESKVQKDQEISVLTWNTAMVH